MRWTFRVTLTTILLTLVVAAVAAVGIVSHVFGRMSVESLSTSIVEQTLRRIDQRISTLLAAAADQSALAKSLIDTGQLDPSDFPRLQAYFAQAMQVQQELTYLGLGLEATGEYCMVERTAAGPLLIREYVLQQGRMVVNDYEPAGASRQYKRSLPSDGYDPRLRPFYRVGKAAGSPVWTETYAFWSTGNRPLVPGLSLATPLYRPDGTLIGVLDADFDLYALCRFLETLRDEVPGFAFVVEIRSDGRRRAIAHPDSRTLLRIVRRPDGKQEHRLAETVAGMRDPRVHAFMARVADRLDRRLRGGIVPVRLGAGGDSYLGGYRLLGGKTAPPWLIGMMVPESTVMAEVARNNRSTLLIGLFSLGAAVAVSVLVSARISRPVRRVAREAEAVGRFELEPHPLGRSPIREMDQLLVAVDEMKTGLRSFRKYVPADLVREVLASGREARLGGARATLTVFFSDIRGFTTISERMEPEPLVDHVGEYLGAMSREIVAEGGTLDKYIGDAIMAFWGAPRPDPDHALAACRAALRNQRRLRELRRKWDREGKPGFHCRIGLSTGELIVGNMGSESRLSYTVIGDPVNLASRLEALNKHYGTEIMMSSPTYVEVREHVVARPLDRVAVKGKVEGTLVHELLGLRGEADEERVWLAEQYGTGLAAYFMMKWDPAIRAFEVVLEQCDDTPTRILLDRCREYARDPPPPDWDGIYRMREK
ncbi:MAG: adenylate/guanylate cyclase domain-containing protein [Planctomycetota bacterium]